MNGNDAIPWKPKSGGDKTIVVSPSTIVDLRTSTDFANEFDDFHGRPVASGGPTNPKGTITTLKLQDYRGSLPAPPVTQTNQVVWKDIVANAGPRVRPAEKSSPQVLARQKVLDALPRPDKVAAP